MFEPSNGQITQVKGERLPQDVSYETKGRQVKVRIFPQVQINIGSVEEIDKITIMIQD